MHWHIQQATHTLNTGGIIAYPTEAVYGLGCDPLNIDAILRLLLIKQRSVAQGFILVAANKDQLKDYVFFPEGEIDNDISASWPGPVTWLLPVKSSVPYWLTGDNDSLAVRVSDQPIVRELCLQFNGPLISTRANLHGRPPARNIAQARNTFRNKIDYFVSGQTGKHTKPTEIRDAASGKIVRASA